MRSLLGIVICAAAATVLTAGCATQTPATTAEVASPAVPTAGSTGTVVRVDQPQRVLVFDNGQMWQVPADSVVLVNGQAVPLAAVQPGTRVTVPTGTLVELQNGRYVAVPPGTVVASSPAAPAVVTAPGVVTTAAPTVRVAGTVTDVDRDGDVKVRTSTGHKFEVRVPPGTAASLHKGDAVSIDFFSAPSASPR